MSFFAELKRRNVIRVGILYLISAWLLLQLTDVLSSLLSAPEWTGSLVVVLLAIGFFPTLAFAWVFELTSEGLKRESEIDHSVSLAASAEQRTNVLITVLLIIAIGAVAVDRLVPERSSPVNEVVDVAGGVILPPKDAGEATIDEASIAVLPFADLSPQQDQQYFTDGISEELLNVLVRVDGLRVASRTSSFGYRNTSLNVSKIGEELKVRHVLEGSVRKDEQRIRVTAQLIDTSSDKHLWSETYDRELSDVFAIQDEIANAIVDALGDELGLFNRTVEVSYVPGTDNLDAYEIFLKAQALFIERINFDESIALYKQAISIDPGFARAWEGLAAVQTVYVDWFTGELLNQDEVAAIVLEIERAANKAIELNTDLSLAYAVLAGIQETRTHDLIESANLYEIALERDPKNATVWLWRGLLDFRLGYLDKAMAEFTACLDFDPAYLNCTTNLAVANLTSGDLATGIRLMNSVALENFWLAGIDSVPYYVEAGQPLIAAAILDAMTAHQGFPSKYFISKLQNPEQDDSVGFARIQEWAKDKDSSSNVLAMYAMLSGRYDEPGLIDRPIWYMAWSKFAADFRQTGHFQDYVRNSGILAYWQAHGFPPQCEPVGENGFRCD